MNSPAAPFKDVHPTPTAGRDASVGGRDLRNSRGKRGDESRWIHCRQCGWDIDMQSTQRGSPYGNIKHIDISSYATGVQAPNEPLVTIGCAFCGSSEF